MRILALLMVLFFSTLNVLAEDILKFTGINGKPVELSRDLPLKARTGQPSLKAALETQQSHVYGSAAFRENSNAVEEARKESLTYVFDQIRSIEHTQKSIWNEYKNKGGDFRMSPWIFGDSVTLSALDAEIADVDARAGKAEAQKNVFKNAIREGRPRERDYEEWLQLEKDLVQLRNKLANMRRQLFELSSSIAAVPKEFAQELGPRLGMGKPQGPDCAIRLGLVAKGVSF